MRIIFVILVSLTIIGCQKPRFVHLPFNPNGPAFLRLQNDTGTNILDVVFQKNRFGNIAAGGLTEYQQAAYAPAMDNLALLPGDVSWTEISFRLPGRTNRVNYVYTDYADRLVQGAGRWTFILTLPESFGNHGRILKIDARREQ